jgi:hypothetical protein
MLKKYQKKEKAKKPCKAVTCNNPHALAGTTKDESNEW